MYTLILACSSFYARVFVCVCFVLSLFFNCRFAFCIEPPWQFSGSVIAQSAGCRDRFDPRLSHTKYFKIGRRWFSIKLLKDFNYLGALLTKTGNFKKAIKTQADKGTKAMYEILKKDKFHRLTTSCQLDLFYKVVKPILLYGSEI